MPDQPREDRDTATPLVLVAVLLVIIATGLIVLQHSGQYPPGGREAVNLAFSSDGLKQLERRWLAPDRSGELLRPSHPNR
jgi:hypothetical protein